MTGARQRGSNLHPAFNLLCKPEHRNLHCDYQAELLRQETEENFPLGSVSCSCGVLRCWQWDEGGVKQAAETPHVLQILVCRLKLSHPGSCFLCPFKLPPEETDTCCLEQGW